MKRFNFCMMAHTFLLGVIGWLFFSTVGLSKEAVLDKNQVLRIGSSRGDVGSLDPQRGTTGQDRNVASLIFSGLLRFKPGSVTAFEPDLAEKLPESKIVDGKRVWTFQLKKGVKVHPFPGYPNGYELTSEDIVFSLEKAANPKLSAFAGDYSGLTFKALGPYTIEVTSDKPLSDTLFFPKIANSSGGFIIPKKAFNEWGEEKFSAHPIGTGPWKFKSYEPGTVVNLVAHDEYFRGAPPHIKKIEYLYVPNISARELGLATRELDLAELGWAADSITRVEGHGVPVKAFEPGSAIAIHFNMSRAPLDNLKVRKAIAYALNRKDVLKYYGRVISPVYGPVPEVMTGGLTAEDIQKAGLDYILEEDLEKARNLLKEAGYPNGFALKVVSSPQVNHIAGYQIAQAQLKRIGIELQIEQVDLGTMHERIRKDVSPFVVYTTPRDNADVYLTQFFHSDSIVVKGKKPVTNFSHYGGVDANGDGKIDSVDNLIDTARHEIDLKKQEEIWKKAQLEILKNVAIFPTGTLLRSWGVQDYLDFGYKKLEGDMNQIPTITHEIKKSK